MMDMKGLSIFELLSGLDDDMIAAAVLPEAALGAAGRPPRRERGRFGEFMNSGWAAAILSVVVSLAVLAGIIAAGQQGPGGPMGKPPVGGTQSEATVEDESLGLLPGEPWEVTVISGDNVVYPKKYSVTINSQYRDENGDLVGMDGDGEGAAHRLGQIKDELPSLPSDGSGYSIHMPDHMSLTRIRVFEVVSAHENIFEEIALPGGFESMLDMAQAIGQREGAYIVVLDIFSHKVISNDEYIKEWSEWAFWLIVGDSTEAGTSPRISLDSPTDSLYLADGDGYMLWTEFWHDGGMVSGDGPGAKEQIAMIVDRLKTMTITERETVSLTFREPGDTLTRVDVLDRSAIPVQDGNDLSVLSELTGGRYFVILTVKTQGEYVPEADAYEASCYEYAFALEILYAPDDMETFAPEDPEIDHPLPEPDMEAVLSKAQPMTPDAPSGAVLVGETALCRLFLEDGRSEIKVSRIAVFRDPSDPYIHYLYTDALDHDGRVLATETEEIHGYFALLRHVEDDNILILATMEGDPSADGTTNTAYGTFERWHTWTDWHAMSGEDIGEVRLLREEIRSWTITGAADSFGKMYIKRAAKSWSALSGVMKGDGGAEKFGVLVDYATETDTPRVYSREESVGAEARAACAKLEETEFFNAFWETFTASLKERGE